jgi:hypothetical protein
MWETRDPGSGRGTSSRNCRQKRKQRAALIIGGFGLLVSGCVGQPSSSERSSPTTSATPKPSRVVGIVAREATTLIELATESGIVTTTAEHPFAKLGSGWTRADRLAAGDRIVTSPGSSIPIVHVRRVEGPPTPVFNLIVEGSHTYYVSEDELLVHNLGCGIDFLRPWRRPEPRSDATSSDPAARSHTSDQDSNEAPRERAKRWARENPWPGEWPTRPEPGSLGTAPTAGELVDVEAYRARTKLRPPPGTLERRRLDEVEATIDRRGQSYPEGSPWKTAEDPRERAKRWARQTPWPAGEWPARPEPGELGSPPTLRELIDLEAYRDGSKLRPPPGTPARRRLDEIETLVQLDESVHGGSSRGGGSSQGDASPRADSPRSEGGLGTAPTLGELLDLESYRDGSKLRPPPGTPERRRVDELEGIVNRWEQSQPERATEQPADGRERARRWARQVPWPGATRP